LNNLTASIVSAPTIKLVGEANAALIEQNIGLLRSVVARFCRSGKIEDSDFYSVACLALVEASTSFDSSKAKFSTWATKIMTQKIIAEIRKTKRKKTIEMSSLETNQTESCLADTRSKTIPTQLLSLVKPRKSDSKSEKQNKLILSMHYLDEKSWSEIGRELGMTREGVRQRAIRAIESIRENNKELLREYLF
jgi:RNA polymerase sigma factor (sigma-70 family)